jgi:DNA-binding response OmpR family regulator
MKIVVVEDDPVCQLILATRLKKLGHEAIVTHDGEEGWRAVIEDQPRLVITDWMMPKLNGLDLCRKIRALDQEKYTYIIILTALTGKKNFLEGIDAGADDFLNKPVDIDELTARLRVAERILALQTEVKQLEGLLPICAYCKKIRDEQNTWQRIEGYISRRTEATFSHGVCPECHEQHVKPELERLTKKRVISAA